MIFVGGMSKRLPASSCSMDGIHIAAKSATLMGPGLCHTQKSIKAFSISTISELTTPSRTMNHRMASIDNVLNSLPKR